MSSSASINSALGAAMANTAVAMVGGLPTGKPAVSRLSEKLLGPAATLALAGAQAPDDQLLESLPPAEQLAIVGALGGADVQARNVSEQPDTDAVLGSSGLRTASPATASSKLALASAQANLYASIIRESRKAGNVLDVTV